MCKNAFSSIFGGGNDAAAQQLAASQAQSTALLKKLDDQQAEREKNITAGQSAIDDAFSQFNDNYYTNYQNAYLNANNPDLDYQFSQANDKLKAALAARGVDNSSISGNAFADLSKTYNDKQSDIAGAAADATNSLKNKVSSAKSNLYAVNSEAADPSLAASQAAAQSTALTALPTSSSVGDVFSSLLAPFTNYVKASSYSPYGSGSGLSLAGSKSSSVY